MKAVMISIQPKCCELICSGKKTLGVRKKRPSIQAPFKCYVYETKSMHGRGKVIGEFICDDILTLGSQLSAEREMLIEEACLTEQELRFYKGKYAWRISDLKVYNKPKEVQDKDIEDFVRDLEIVRAAVNKTSDKWIPVTERLPDEHENYIVTVCDECNMIWAETVVVLAEYFEGSWLWYEGGDEYDITDMVIAWMTLPEPYKVE